MSSSKCYNELRWNPLLGCWVIVSSQRSRRPWRHVERCPFCPGSEETGTGWNVLVLDNKFPALRRGAIVSRESKDVYLIREAYGSVKVVIETPEHEGDLDTIPFENLTKYIELLRSVTEKECSDEKIQYVLPFRNKGEVIGVSLTHPHSQVYALPFIPPRIAREIEMLKKFKKERGECLICHIAGIERRVKERVIYENKDFVALLPFFAMWPYEVHIYPLRHFGSLKELSTDETRTLADAIRFIVATYNSLFGFSLPYMMIFHQSPCHGEADFHFHIEFYPVHRSQDKLKYPAGVEWGGWVFTYDGLPEEKAGELKEAARRAYERLKIGATPPLSSPA
jgi:UDPglucose--hexose-1-phosphate uridylyltransferase